MIDFHKRRALVGQMIKGEKKVCLEKDFLVNRTNEIFLSRLEKSNMVVADFSHCPLGAGVIYSSQSHWAVEENERRERKRFSVYERNSWWVGD